jgi:hypothetical protein
MRRGRRRTSARGTRRCDASAGDETVEKPRHVVGGGIHVGDVATRAERAARSAQQHRAGAVLLRPGVRRVELAQGLRVSALSLSGRSSVIVASPAVASASSVPAAASPLTISKA